MDLRRPGRRFLQACRQILHPDSYRIFRAGGVGAAQMRVILCATAVAAAGRGADMSSLRIRLVLIPTAILLLGLVTAAGFVLHHARARVQAELESGRELGRILVQAELRDLAHAPDAAGALARLGAGLPRIRHVRLHSLAAPGVAADLPGAAATAGAPAWFAALFATTPVVETFAGALADGTPVVIGMTSHPQDEIDEIWDDFTAQVVLLLALALLTAGLVFWTVTLALRPIQDLARGFDRLEHGDYTVRLTPIRVAELRRVGVQFDRLAGVLGRITTDNRTLIDRLISLQEAERKEVAHELHDEFGPALFGIRADVACILRAVREGGAAAEIEDRARAIAALADSIQRINARMLDRLRPLVLEQMGLGEAVRQLVATWQRRYPQTDWSLDLGAGIGGLEEGMALTVYRVVQECLTNCARHAAAGRVAVRLDRDGEGGSALHVCVRDDGRGVPAELRFGFGLLGMAERVRALAGRLAVCAGPGGGTLVEVVLPLPEAVA